MNTLILAELSRFEVGLGYGSAFGLSILVSVLALFVVRHVFGRRGGGE